MSKSPIHEISVVGSHRLDLVVHHVLLHLDPAPAQAGQLVHRRVPRHEEGDVGGHLLGDGEHVEPVNVHGVTHLL